MLKRILYVGVMKKRFYFAIGSRTNRWNVWKKYRL